MRMLRLQRPHAPYEHAGHEQRHQNAGRAERHRSDGPRRLRSQVLLGYRLADLAVPIGHGAQRAAQALRLVEAIADLRWGDRNPMEYGLLNIRIQLNIKHISNSAYHHLCATRRNAH